MKKIFFKYQILTLVVIFIFLYKLSAQPIQFFQEKIEVELNNDYCTITGIYYFKNTGAQEIQSRLYYPFVVHDELLFPHYIKVQDLTALKNVPYQSSDRGISFSINVVPDSVSVYKVTYFQKTLNNEIEYILTTTQKWRRPFEQAEYIIKIPVNFKIKYLSLKLEQMEMKGNQKVFYCKKSDFMPDKNLIINWEIENENNN